MERTQPFRGCWLLRLESGEEITLHSTHIALGTPAAAEPSEPESHPSADSPAAAAARAADDA